MVKVVVLWRWIHEREMISRVYDCLKPRGGVQGGKAVQKDMHASKNSGLIMGNDTDKAAMAGGKIKA